MSPSMTSITWARFWAGVGVELWLGVAEAVGLGEADGVNEGDGEGLKREGEADGEAPGSLG